MRRPTRVIVVHDEGMGMVALTVQMRMIWREIGMAVLQNLRVAHWPEPQRDDDARSGKCRKNTKRCNRTGLRHQPAR